MTELKPALSLNLQPPLTETNALSITPQGQLEIDVKCQLIKIVPGKEETNITYVASLIFQHQHPYIHAFTTLPMTFPNFFVPCLKANNRLTNTRIIVPQIDPQKDIQAHYCTTEHIKVQRHGTSLIPLKTYD